MLPLSSFNFFYYWGVSIVNAFIPLLFREKGLSTGEIGVLLAVGAFISIISQPLWGMIADRKQTVKKIVLLLLFMTLLSSLGVFYGSSVFFLMAAMLLFHFLMSPVQPLVDSMSTTYAAENGVSYGSIRIWGSLGFAFASMFIGLIVGAIGLQYLWFLYAGVLVISFWIATKLKDSTVKKPAITRAAMSKTFRNPGFIGFLVAVLFIGIPTRMNDGMLGIHMKNLGATEGNVGLAWMASSLSEAPVIGLMYILMRKVPLLILISGAGALYSVRWLLYAHLDQPLHLVAGQTMHSITFAIFFVASMQYVAKVVPSEMLATGQTIFFATYSGLASIIGNTGGGYLMQFFGATVLYTSGAFLSLIGTLICIGLYVHSQKKRMNHSLSS